jgi:DNA-binding beta-propeller fold protein YncE
MTTQTPPRFAPIPPPSPPRRRLLRLLPGPVRLGGRRRRIAVFLTVTLLLALFIAIAVYYFTTHKPLTTIPGLSREDVPHYVFSIYGVTRPMGVAVSPSGERIYVAESDGARLVRVFNRAGKPVGALPTPPTGVTHIPVYVAVNPVTRDVYVSDRAARTVYVYSEKNVYRGEFRPRGNIGGRWEPLGLAFDADGALYATDVSGPYHRLLVFRPDGRLLRSLGAPKQLSFPNGIVVDSRGTVYATDSNNGRLVVFDAEGTLATTIGRGAGAGDLGLPRGLAIGDGNRLYVVETVGHEVKVYRLGKSGSVPRYVGSFGQEGQAGGAFEYPNGVAVDNRARVYVTDRENNRVQAWSY